MSKKTFNQFIQDKFNDDTIDSQIFTQQQIISKAEREIKRLSEIREEQLNKPWYRWDGVSFIHEGWNHSNGFASDKDCTDSYTRYEDFVVTIIKQTDRDLRYFGPDYSIFSVIAPGQDDHDLKHEEVLELPLVKEYYERKEARKMMEADRRESKLLETKINGIEQEFEMFDKYTEGYIQSLRETHADLLSQREALYEKMEHGETATRLKELDEILVEIDMHISR